MYYKKKTKKMRKKMGTIMRWESWPNVAYSRKTPDRLYLRRKCMFWIIPCTFYLRTYTYIYRYIYINYVLNKKKKKSTYLVCSICTSETEKRLNFLVGISVALRDGEIVESERFHFIIIIIMIINEIIFRLFVKEYRTRVSLLFFSLFFFNMMKKYKKGIRYVL